MTAIRIVFGAVFVWFLCLAAGQLFFRAIRLKLPSREAVFPGFLTGAALVSTIMFALACGRLVYTNVIVVTGVTTIGWWVWRCRACLPRKAFPDDLPPLWRMAFLVPLVIYGYIYVFSAMGPEVSPDGPVYHVGLISRYYDHRGFFALPKDMFGGFPEGIEMLFWIGFALGRHSAAAMVHLLFLLTMPFGMLSFAERLRQPKAGVVAALLFYLAPVAGKDGTVAYVDTGTAVVVFGAVYLLWLWREADCRQALIPAALLAGYCYACKMTAGIAIPFCVAFVLVAEVVRGNGWRRAVRSGAFATLLASAVALPWMLKNVVTYHNPFYPLFNHLFPNPFLYPMVEDQMRQSFPHLGNVPYKDFFFQITVGGQLTAIIGPAFLLAPAALLSLRFSAGRLCLLAFLVFLAPFFSDTDTRFLLPSLPFLSLAIGLGLLSIPRAGAALGLVTIAFHACTAWPGVVQRFVPGYQWRVDVPDIRAALRIVPEKRWLTDHWREYGAGLMLDRFVPAGNIVFSPDMGQIAYHHRELISSFGSTLGTRTYYLLLTQLADGLAQGWHRDIRFPPVNTARIRLQSAVRTENELLVSEFRIFNGEVELPRRADWRLTASRNPWDIQMAFDNDKLTWWTSGQNVDPQTWIEVDLPQSVSINRLTVDQVQDQQWMELYASAWVNGAWIRLKSTEETALIPRRTDLRMAIHDEWKASGIRWILMLDGNPFSDDFRNKSPYWGITQIAESGGFRLWKLD